MMETKIKWTEFLRKKLATKEISYQLFEELNRSDVKVVINGEQALLAIAEEGFDRSYIKTECKDMVLALVREYTGYEAEIFTDDSFKYFPEILEEINKEKLSRQTMILDASRIPLNTVKKYTFANYKVQAENKDAVGKISKFPNEKAFLTICGGTGLGKTHLAIALGVEYIKNSIGSVCYYQVEDLLDELRNTYSGDSKMDYEKVMKRLTECKLLILDDFGTQKNTDYTLAKLDLIIDTRYINDRKTVVTTNLSLKDIKDISERIMSRLASGDIVTLKGKDYRMSR